MTQQIICITSQKGGVAKTTTATSIAAGLAIRGASVLLMDYDPQGHSAISLGMDPEPGVFNWLINDEQFVNVVRHTTRPGLALLPGNGHTKRAELWLRNETTLDQMIRRVRDAIAGGWNYIVIDTPASGYLQELAIRLADVLVVPVRCETLGLDGVGATMQTAHAIGNADAAIILPTMYDRRLREHAYNLDILCRNYPHRVAEPVPARVAVAEAVALGLTVWEHGNGAMLDVRAAYGELLERIVGPEGTAGRDG